MPGRSLCAGHSSIILTWYRIMKYLTLVPAITISILFTACVYSQTKQNTRLPGFSASPQFAEQEMTLNFQPGVRAVINAPAADAFDPQKPVKLLLFGIPNTNTIELTMGKKLHTGDNKRYDIQHIAAQTRFLRNMMTDCNIVIAYLKTEQKSWPAWRRANPDNAILIHRIVDSLRNLFSSYKTTVTLTGHSGGGSFTFGYINGCSAIPDYVERIAFMDSNYGYEEELHGKKIAAWLASSPEHFLSNIAYNDSVALNNGKPDVGPTEGTWYRSRLMFRYLKDHFLFSVSEDTAFVKYTAHNKQITMVLRQNPERRILHTVMVELNGFIHSIASGTQYENQNYIYYGPRAYSDFIYDDAPMAETGTR